MKSIGIRELRRHAGRYLREVERGDSIEVTDHGRPIARLVPTPRSSSAEAVALAGQPSPARGDVLELGAPLKPLVGVALPSAELAAMREDDR